MTVQESQDLDQLMQRAENMLNVRYIRMQLELAQSGNIEAAMKVCQFSKNNPNVVIEALRALSGK